MKSSLRDWIARHQLVSFFALAYLIMFGFVFAYVYWIPIPYPIVWVFSVFSPTISALVISWIVGGMSEIKRVLAGFTRWNAGLRWYLAAFFLLLAPLLVALVYIILGNPIPGPKPGLTVPLLLGQLVFTLFSGPLSEEAGWRGFALPRLQEKYSALVSSLILNLIWACWHIPLFFQPGTTQQSIPFPIYVVMTLALGTYITWLYNNTRGSLVITVLAHFLYNCVGGFIAGTLGLLPPMVLYISAGSGLAIAAVLVVIVFGPRYLSRKPVGELPFRPKDDAQSLAAQQTSPG
jgi:membrane protease YdiL (CAAX protease family)